MKTNKMYRVSLQIACLTVLFLLIEPLVAQDSAIQGIVVDESGGVIPSADISATSTNLRK